MIIADTNVVSEFMKDSPDPAVLTWARTLDPTEITISVVTVEEIERGLGRVPAGRRRTHLEQRWHSLLAVYTDIVATYDLAAAQATAALQVTSLDRGRPMHLADAQIAGTCLSLGGILATRNTKDFAHIDGLSLVDPFSS